MESYPPPAAFGELPEYHLGRLLYYDEMSHDNCRWIVYDGIKKVRCPSRTAALNYITEQNEAVPDVSAKAISRARFHLNRAIMELDFAALHSPNRLILERLAVRLRPFLVEIDNQIPCLSNLPQTNPKET